MIMVPFNENDNIIDKNSNKELWTGYMNTSQDIIKELEDYIYED